ncbi:hypothetical protein ACWF99_20940 [Nocardia sp. NPDC055002]|uniref:hypothetical protein n=1 Tax=Nocardia sp. NPDC056952 TaxID=3345979 RepID=UPI00362EC584
MTTTVTVDGQELAFAVENNMLVVSIVADGIASRRGSIFIGALEPEPGPVYIEPDPVAPQPEPSS